MPELREDWTPIPPAVPQFWLAVVAWFLLGAIVDLAALVVFFVSLFTLNFLLMIASGAIWVLLTIWLACAIERHWPPRVVRRTYRDREGIVTRRPVIREMQGRVYLLISKGFVRQKETWVPAEEWGYPIEEPDPS